MIPDEDFFTLSPSASSSKGLRASGGFRGLFEFPRTLGSLSKESNGFRFALEAFGEMGALDDGDGLVVDERGLFTEERPWWQSHWNQREIRKKGSTMTH